MATRTAFQNHPTLGRTLSFRNDAATSQPAVGSSLWQTCPILEILQDPTVGILFRDDFVDYLTTVRWTSTISSSSTVAIDNLPGGVVKLTCNTADNAYACILGTQDAWLFAPNKPLWFEAKIAVTEANTNAANWGLGLMDVGAATSIADDGGGLVSSFDGAMFYKVESTMAVKFNGSNAATAGTASTEISSYTSGTYYRLGFTFNPNDGTTGILTPYVNGVAGTAQNIAISGLDDEMQPIFIVKGGGAAEVGRIDWMQIAALR